MPATPTIVVSKASIPDRSSASSVEGNGGCEDGDLSPPKVIGLYGVPGCGKSTYLERLQQFMATMKTSKSPQQCGKGTFAFFEGSFVIGQLVEDGLKKFQSFSEEKKYQVREQAIRSIASQTRDISPNTTAVVTGHFSFHGGEHTVFTSADAEVFSHIIYIKVNEDIVRKRRQEDESRHRESMSSESLRSWMEYEIAELQALCLKHKILFMCLNLDDNENDLRSDVIHVQRLADLLIDFAEHNESVNESRVLQRVEEFVKPSIDDEDEDGSTVLVLDADKTLADEDTGVLFWREAGLECPLQEIFGQLGYCYHAFRQASCFYESSMSALEYEANCQHVAEKVSMHAPFVQMLKTVPEFGAIVVTSGLARVWEIVLKREGLHHINVVGGGTIRDSFVIHAHAKQTVVECLQQRGYRVFAFGDSPIDVPMLMMSDHAFVVVGDENGRSKSMDDEVHLLKHAQQILMPSTAQRRPHLPAVEFETVSSEISTRFRDERIVVQVHHFTNDEASKLLATPTRDASVSGPALRRAHRRIGEFLAGQVASCVGLEQYDIEHVQGNVTTGYRLLHEAETSIVALMRGGEPLASGLSTSFPLSMFVHANGPSDVRAAHVAKTVILVDSVVNSGATVVRFLRHIRNLNKETMVVVVTAVLQNGARKGPLVEFAQDENIVFIALRLSENKFIGAGKTDTGDRLFNTTHC